MTAPLSVRFQTSNFPYIYIKSAYCGTHLPEAIRACVLAREFVNYET
jgi:hypothetical protein